MALIIGVVTFGTVLYTLKGRAVEPLDEWSNVTSGVSILFWIYNGCLVLLVTVLQFLNTLFLMAGMQDYAKRNFVAGLLADVLEVDIGKKKA